MESVTALKAERATASDAEVLDELRGITALPDESAADWAKDVLWERTYLLVALAELVGERRLLDGIGLVLDRMCLGDPAELMSGMRLAFEAAVTPEWGQLVAICVERCESDRAGTRYWALDELGVLRDPGALPAVLARFEDRDADVAALARRTAIAMLERHAELRPQVVSALRAAAWRDRDLRDEIEAAIAAIQRTAPVIGSVRNAITEVYLVDAIRTRDEPEVARGIEALLIIGLRATDEWDATRWIDGLLADVVTFTDRTVEVRGRIIWGDTEGMFWCDPLHAQITLTDDGTAIATWELKFGDAKTGFGTTAYGDPPTDLYAVTDWVFVFHR